MDGKDKAVAFGLGALGGGVAGFLVWMALRSVVARQVTTTIDETVPPLVRQEIDRKLTEVGLNATTAANMRTILANLEQLGVFSALATGTAPRR